MDWHPIQGGVEFFYYVNGTKSQNVQAVNFFPSHRLEVKSDYSFLEHTEKSLAGFSSQVNFCMCVSAPS